MDIDIRLFEYIEGACVGVLNEKFSTSTLCLKKYPKMSFKFRFLKEKYRDECFCVSLKGEIFV